MSREEFEGEVLTRLVRIETVLERVDSKVQQHQCILLGDGNGKPGVVSRLRGLEDRWTWISGGVALAVSAAWHYAVKKLGGGG